MISVMVGVVEMQFFQLAGLSAPIEVELGGGIFPPANPVGLQSFYAGPLPCVPEPSGGFMFGALLIGWQLLRR